VAFVPTTPASVARQQLAPSANVAAAQIIAPTATAVLIANRVLIPDNCIELVNNGSFEARGMGWSQEGSKILPAYGAPALTANAQPSGVAIRLGLTDVITATGISATQQLLQLPADRNQITLRFRYFPLYATPVSRGDYQYVDIYHGESGQFMGRVLGIQSNARQWLDAEYDLSKLAGEAVRLFFMVSNDGIDGNIAMYIDDVSVLACRVARIQPALPAQEGVAGGLQEAQESLAGVGTPQPLATFATNSIQPQADVAPVGGFTFGRMGGLLAVLGIAGTLLVLLPLTRRFRGQ
jgi:hypothetical protein